MANEPVPLIAGMACSPDDALRRLMIGLYQARAGHGLTLLVSGEAGSGKSQVVASMLQEARRLGQGIFEVRLENEDGTTPDALLLAMLRALLGMPEVVREYLSAVGRDVVALLPEAGALLDATGPGGRGRESVLTAAAAAIAGLSDEVPLAISIEDLHRADTASNDFVLALARAATGKPVLLVLTFRSDEGATGLSTLLQRLEQEGLGYELRLEGSAG